MGADPPTDTVHADLRAHRVKKYAGALAGFWTLAVAGSLFWSLHLEKEATLELARIRARDAHDKDVLYRRWNAGHGGVYVPVTEETPKNPYLSVDERDITTPSGRVLTLVNPAYMTRQVHELGEKQYGIRGHLTSLDPIRPENAADPWEAHALQAFERGETEVSSIEKLDGEAYLRLMRPLVTEKSCLECHASQGYGVGDIRGGISVAVPLGPLLAIARTQNAALAQGHALFWLLGLGGLGLAAQRVSRQIQDYNREARKLSRIQAAVDDSSEAIIIIESDRTVSYINVRFGELFWSTLDRINEDGWESIFVDRGVATRIWDATKLLDDWIGEIDMVSRQDRPFPGEVRAAPVIGDGSAPCGVLLVINDITKRKRAEAERISFLKVEQERDHLREALNAQERVLGVVGHELRTPLAGVRAMTEFLLGDDARDTAEFDTFLRSIHDEVVKMSSTVNDTLEVARMNSGTAQWNWARVNVAEVCRQAMETLRPLVDQSQVTLRLEVEPPDLAMRGDPGAIRRLVVNLLSNATKHTPQGSITVRAAAQTIEHRPRVLLEVEDTGEGMPPEIASRLGVAFALNSGIVGESHVRGTGLGLAICKGIVAVHGGHIRVRTSPGEGTTISIDLPTDQSEPAPTEQAGDIVWETTP